MSSPNRTFDLARETPLPRARTQNLPSSAAFLGATLTNAGLSLDQDASVGMSLESVTSRGRAEHSLSLLSGRSKSNSVDQGESGPSESRSK